MTLPSVGRVEMEQEGTGVQAISRILPPPCGEGWAGGLGNNARYVSVGATSTGFSQRQTALLRRYAMAGLISRGFLGRRRPAEMESRLPPGQYLVTDFPVLSAGPTPHTPLDKWSFTMEGLVRSPVTWSWAAFQKLPTETFTVDISCVTKWTKLDTNWVGVTVDTLLETVRVDPAAQYV